MRLQERIAEARRALRYAERVLEATESQPPLMFPTEHAADIEKLRRRVYRCRNRLRLLESERDQ